nr:acyltransferase [Acetobacter lambici]
MRGKTVQLSEPKGNLRFLDGLRGILCLIVIFSHCVQAYWPDLRFTADRSFFGMCEHFIANTPLNLFYSGLPPVTLFFIMSGFVISYKYNKTRDRKIITNSALKRYFRFLIPVTISYVFMYVLSVIFFPKPIGLKRLIIQAFFKTYFFDIKTINPILWTISFEVMGSFLVFALLALFGDQKNRLFFYFIVMLFFIKEQYCFFVFGLMMSDIYVSGGIRKATNGILNYSLFALGLILISYPIHYDMDGDFVDGMYKYITFSKNWDLNYAVFLRIGCFLFFISVLRSGLIQGILERKVILFIGKISFSLYVLHFMILECILAKMGNVVFFRDFIFYSILTFAITIVVAIPFEIYVDRQGIRISNRIANFLMEAKLVPNFMRINSVNNKIT